jgi:transposase
MAARAEIVLTNEEREVLERWARRPKSSQALAFRCRIVLAAAEGRSSKQIADELGCNHNTVGKWRGRFARRGFDGLHDEPRPGKPRSISDEQVERVIVKTLEEQPAQATHWSTRSMAAATGMSQSAISRIWRAFALKPHQVETFRLSPDPQFIDKVRDIVGLYLNPPEAAVVLCVDEKSQIQALDRSAPVLPLMPGVPARQSHDYLRNGTTNLYAALDVASGQVLAEMTPRHRAEEFRRFLNLIDASVPAHLAGARRARQLLHPQDALDPTLACPPSALHAPLHPDLQLLAESRRALVRRTDHEMDQTRQPPLRPRARRLDPHLDRQLERRPETIRLAQERRPDPGQPRRLLPTD